MVNRALAGGATVVILPRFELEPFLRVVQDYRVTRAIVVPPIVLALAKQPVVDRYDLSSLNVILSVAAPLSDHTARACAERIGCVVKQGYGMTETAPALQCTPDAADKCQGGRGRTVRSEYRMSGGGPGHAGIAGTGRTRGDLGARPAGDAGVSQPPGCNRRDHHA